MNEPKFTKGPWSISRYASTHVVANERGICSAGNYSDNMSEEALLVENEANAQLIATAPKLYEALESMLEHAEWSTPQGKAAFDNARAVLAEARGEKT